MMVSTHGCFSQPFALLMALFAILTLQIWDVSAFRDPKLYDEAHAVAPMSSVDRAEIAKMKLLDALNRQPKVEKKPFKEGLLEQKDETDADEKGPSSDVTETAVVAPQDDMEQKAETEDSIVQETETPEATETQGHNSDLFSAQPRTASIGVGPKIKSVEDNLHSLEKSVGLEGFYKPFAESLDEHVRQILTLHMNTDYIELYRRYAQRLEGLEKQTSQKIVRLVETKSDSLALINFSEKQSGSLLSDVQEDAMKMAGVTSMLQLGNGDQPRQLVSRRDMTPIALKKLAEHQGKNTAKQQQILSLAWKENQRVMEALMIKSLYLLGGDTKTSDLKERLENLAIALGYKSNPQEKQKKYSIPTPFAIRMGMELFSACGNNPFLLGHLAVNMLAYNEFQTYFVNSNAKPFYSWLELVASGSIDTLDKMCGTKRGSRYKKSSSGKIVPNNNRVRKDDINMKPDSIFLCNLIEVLMISINSSMDEMGNLLKTYGMPYEPNIGAVDNGNRMQLFLCSEPTDAAIVIRCDFKSSVLVKPKHYKGKSREETKEHLLKLHEAFDLFKLMSEVGREGEIPYTWMRMISDPRRYQTIMENAIKHDRRMFSGKKKSWRNGYTDNEMLYIGVNNVSGNVHTAMAISMLNKTSSNVYNPNGFRRPLLYMSASRAKSWVENNLQMLQERFGFSPSSVLSGNLALYFQQISQSVTYGLSHILLYYMLTTNSPAYHLQKEMNSFRGGNTVYNIVESSNIFIPRSLKRGLKWLLRGGLGREFQREKAKHSLLRLLPIELIQKAISSITFVTHSLADLQLNQNAAIWGRGLLYGHERHDRHFIKGGYMNYVDSIIRQWSDEGYTDSMAKRLKDGEELTKDDIKAANMHNITHSESLQWDKHLNSLVLEGYNKFLDLASIKVLEGKQSLLYEIVRDSRDNLEKNLAGTVFFGRVIDPPTYNNKWKRMWKRASNAGKMIFNRSLQNVEHALWFGVKLNYQSILEVVEELNRISTLLSSTESYSLQEAFSHIIDDAVSVVSNQEYRLPQGVQENFGIPSINPIYVRMSPDERKIEFQQGMCGQHCGAIWKALLAFTMSTMRSPASIKTFERSLSQNGSIKEMHKPEFINSMRFILKSDALLHMYDSMLPKKMKRELRAIKYGKAFYFANIMKMASNLLGMMGYKYTSHMLKIQAPYFGNFVVQWDRQREKSKTKAIFSYLSLGTMATYSIMQCAEITQHATDIGQGPVEDCFTLLKPPRVHCVAKPVQAIAKSALSAGVQDTLSVTVMAVIGPYFFLPMAAHASWQILKHHFKILHRLDIALSATFKRMWNKITSLSVAKKLAEWFAKRREHRKAIEEEGLIAMKAGKIALEEDKFGSSAVHDELLQQEDTVSYTTLH